MSTRDWRSIWPLLSSFRLHNGLGCGIVFLAARRSVQLDEHPADAMAVAGLILLCSSSHLVNDLLDWWADRSNRPGRPLPAGRVSLAQMRLSALLTWLAGWALGWLAEPELGNWWAFWALAGPGYSLFAKGRGWLAPFWTASVVASCWLGPALQGACQVWHLGAGAAIFYFILFREFVKMRADLTGDLKAGYWNPAGSIPSGPGVLASLASPLFVGLGWVAWQDGLSAASFLAVAMALLLLWVVLLPGRSPVGNQHLGGTILKVNSFLGLGVLLNMMR